MNSLADQILDGCGPEGKRKKRKKKLGEAGDTSMFPTAIKEQILEEGDSIPIYWAIGELQSVAEDTVKKIKDPKLKKGWDKVIQKLEKFRTDLSKDGHVDIDFK